MPLYDVIHRLNLESSTAFCLPPFAFYIFVCVQLSTFAILNHPANDIIFEAQGSGAGTGVFRENPGQIYSAIIDYRDLNRVRKYIKFNMIDPLPIPINMIKQMLLADAITFQYMKPDLFKRPAPATMHSIDLMNYLIKDYRKTILTNEPEKIFYKL